MVSALAVPVQRADAGSGSSSRSVRKRSTKKSAVRVEDEVVGLEPGDEALGAVALDAAEADEGVHLVQVAADRLRHALEADARAGRWRPRAAWRSPWRHAPDQARRAGRSAPGRGGRRRAGSGRPSGAAAGRRAGAASQRTARRRGPASACVDQVTSSGGTPAATRRADGVAEAVEIGAGGEDDPAIIRRARAARAGATRRLRRSSRSRPPGAVVGGDQEGRGASGWRRGGRGRRGAAARWRRARIRSTALTPRPGTRSSISRGARLTSTGKRSRCFSAQASFGSMSRSSMPSSPPAAISSTVEAVKAHQPIGLVEPVLALQRRRLQRQGGARLGDRAEGGIIDALEPVSP